jgi:fatty acid desaturase
MNAKQIGFEAVLIGFSTLTAYTVYQHGYIGFFELILANVATITAFVDLIIALGLILLWMWQDAGKRGVSLVPYLILTLTLGSVGPLLYLIRRAGSEQAAPVRISAREVHS